MGEPWFSLRRIALTIGLALAAVGVAPHGNELPALLGGLLVGYFLLPLRAPSKP